MDQLDRLGALADPTRRNLFRVVTEASGAIGRDAAAKAAGVTRALAAFHLDRLLDAGPLPGEVRPRRRPPRGRVPTAHRTHRPGCRSAGQAVSTRRRRAPGVAPRPPLRPNGGS